MENRAMQLIPYFRLFANQSLHLIHSSNSIHWLSQVPEGLENNSLNIYMAKSSPPNVFQEYGKQFKSDFTKFLQLRSEEIICGGHMVLTLAGRSVADPTSDDGCCLWELLAQSLLDMVKEEIAIRKVLPVLRHTIKGITNHDLFSGRCFKIADLGCSSSKNTLLVAFNIMDIVVELCEENNLKPPQFHVCLNDLIGNDFNTLFNLLPDFYAKLHKEKGENFGPCFISAAPGSFYRRLFSDQSMHLVHSSNGVHWLSQVPEGLESNMLNIYIAKSSPLNVFQAYEKQFETDFTKFLQMRSEEVVCGGRMVLTFCGRSIDDPTSDDGCRLWELLAESLFDMVKEGLVRESDISSFNVPIYYPGEDEVRDIIQNEGSFSLESLATFQVDWDPQNMDYKNFNDFVEPSQTRGENTTKGMRAVIEPLLTSHFGKSITDGLFKKYHKYVAQHLSNNKPGFFSFVISLAKK
ncbi:hypothetical protein SSX86_027377 [Deinandra increscens subsp. villosa]|uniref:Uncharacterized protein n=1 Tax=Deinandra increscens subsp. villosa TaxID=3103831 RepID=A0AAP0CM15_9ASTR